MTTSPHPLRVGLVLGGGGAAGLAFHAGALLALHHDLDWDPRSAEVVVGTSAGSIVAALLRSGLDPDDLAAWAADANPRPERDHLRDVLDRARDARPRLRLPSWPQVVPSPGAVLSMARGRIGLTGLVLSQLPFGIVDTAAAIETFGELHDQWPTSTTWITATRLRDGALVVFGRETPAPVGRAVAASCAIPGLHRAVRVEDERYVDGGVHSPTNAELLLEADVDCVIVLSPMSQRHPGHPLRPERRLRRHFRSLLDQECAALAAAGIPTTMIEPDEPTVEAMGIDLLDRDRATRVLSASFLGTAAQLHDEFRTTLITGVPRPVRRLRRNVRDEPSACAPSAPGQMRVATSI